MQSRPDADPWRQRAVRKPRYRGLVHKYAFVCSLPVGVATVVSSPSGAATFGAAIYAYTVSLMFGTSALFHLPDYDDDHWYRMRRVDHTAIFLTIAGTFTPVAMFGLDGWQQVFLLVGGWSGAAASIAVRWSRREMPRGVVTGLAIGLGWISIVALPWVWASAGGVATSLILLGGVTYTVGALVVGFRWPDPWPDVFGYHEVWHVAVVVAVLLHYVAIVFYVLH